MSVTVPAGGDPGRWPPAHGAYGDKGTIMSKVWRIEIIGEALGPWQDRPSEPVDYPRHIDAVRAFSDLLESIEVTAYGPFERCECSEEDICLSCDLQDEARAFAGPDGPLRRADEAITFDPPDHRILVKLYPVES